jgi:hypothetical protein
VAAAATTARLWQRLKEGGEVGHLAYHPAFLGLSGADNITDRRQAGREGLLGTQLADGLDERQRRPNRTFGIVLVRLAIAEINEHPIAHVLGHEAVEPATVSATHL